MLALFASAVLVGCGKGDKPNAAPTPSGSASSTASASPTSTPTATLLADLGPDVFDSVRALEHDRVLSVDIGIRAAGTDGELRAAEYIRNQLASYGYDTELQPFPFDTFIDLESRLEVVSPDSREIDALALQGSGKGVVEAEVVDAGLGRPEDFPSDIAGKIALVQRGEIRFSAKVANAAAVGAGAIVIYNNEPGLARFTLTEAGAIPSVSISQEDGQSLLALGSPRPVMARVTVQTDKKTEQSRNVIGRSPGHKCRIVVGGHYDSVPAGPGANDNGSGTATVIEMARVLAVEHQLDVCVVLFGAEELGLLGSMHYVGALSEAERADIKDMLNFDMIAVGNDLPLTGSKDLVHVAAQEAQRLGVVHSVPPQQEHLGGSDHASFIAVGIPAILFNCFCDRDNYHRATDVFEHVQQRRLQESGALGLAVVDRLLAQ